MPKQSEWKTTLRMKQIPKAEYTLMKTMIEQYALDGPNELFTALLRLAVEVQTFGDDNTINGQTFGARWLQRLITETVTAMRQ